MKKLGKLQFNSEKVMKNEELTTLRGGYNGTRGLNCSSGSVWLGCQYTICEMTWTEAYEMCRSKYGPSVDDAQGGCNVNCPQ
jgi:natural product precursor